MLKLKAYELSHANGTFSYEPSLELALGKAIVSPDKDHTIVECTFVFVPARRLPSFLRIASELTFGKVVGYFLVMTADEEAKEAEVLGFLQDVPGDYFDLVLVEREDKRFDEKAIDACLRKLITKDTSNE